MEDTWITIEAEQAAAETVKQEADQNYEAALTAWASAPDWLKTYSDEDIENYVAVNVTNLESAKTALVHLGKAVRIIVKALKLNYLIEQS